METQTNVQPNSSKFNIGFFFLSLGVLITLINSVTSFINLIFETLQKRFPDVLNSTYQYGYNSYDYQGIRSALATLIIFFPVFLIISYFWNKFARRGLDHFDEVVRKWLIYIILFLSALISVIDLVTLVNYFISGEITSRFVYKVITVLVVAVLVGFYYIVTLRNNLNSKIKYGLIFGIVGTAIVLGGVVYSFMIMGSPAKQRALRLDDRRVSDLQNIQSQVITYWQQKEKLPQTLNDLANPLSYNSLPVPPGVEQGEKYEYSVLAPMKFELCATFEQPIPKGWREYSSSGGGIVAPMAALPVSYENSVSTSSMPYYPGYGGGTNESWDHQAGRTCFDRTIDKDLYPPYPKPKTQ